MTEEEGPESPVPARERPSSATRPFQDVEWVPEGEDLGREGGPRANEATTEPKTSLTTVSIRVR
jgi:hypothetical protein